MTDQQRVAADGCRRIPQAKRRDITVANMNRLRRTSSSLSGWLSFVTNGKCAVLGEPRVSPTHATSFAKLLAFGLRPTARVSCDEFRRCSPSQKRRKPPLALLRALRCLVSSCGLRPVAYGLSLGLLFLLSPLFTGHWSLTTAQSESAGVSGRVTDQSNLVMPEVEVEAKNTDTGVTYTTKTNGSGFYSLPNLPPGNYLMNVRRLQFRTVSVTGITLHVQDQLSRNFVMQVGSADVSITVDGSGLVINTTDASVSTTIDRNFAENLPLNGRSFQTLILLTPGTVLIPVGNDSGTFSVNGQRPNTNNFTVDGVSANLGGYFNQSTLGQFNGANPNFTTAGTTQGMVSVDALQEFKIQTSTFAPEFGRQPGGQVSLLTRSGTNALHGTAFDYVRNDALDANNWFSDAKGLPKGKERQNDFGGTLGGPVRIPGLYKGNDKTFFFFSYEGLRLLVPNTFVDTVPSLCLRGTGTCTGGESPAAPAYQAILKSWPNPDSSEFVNGKGSPTGAASYTQSESLPTNFDAYSVRVDHSLRDGFNLFGRYSGSISDFTSYDQSNENDIDKLRTRGLTLGLDAGIRANLQNELRFNYSDNASTIDYVLHLVGGAQTFNTSLLYPAPIVPGTDWASWSLSLPGLQESINPGLRGKYFQRQLSAVDSISYSIGSHRLKWGVDYRILFPTYGPPPLIATYKVTSTSDLDAGNVSIAQTIASQTAHPIYTNFSVYGQDTWRASDRLTLTYGLRWELNPAPGERNGIQPLNVIGLNNPITATLAPINSKLYRTTFNNFAPRVGVAYQVLPAPGHETVLRGGFGVFYDLDSETSAIGFGQAPFQNNSPVLRTLPGTSNPLPFPVPANVLPVASVPASLTPPYNFSIYGIDQALKLPYSLQWNVSVEQALGRNQSLAVSYVASAGYRLLRSDTLFGLNTALLNVFVVRNAASSNYESLQVQFNRHLFRGLQGLASYTYSHSIDNASDAEGFAGGAASALSGSSAGNVFVNPNVDKGDSAFDLRHAFRAAVSYTIPTWNAVWVSRVISGGWSLDTIAIAQSALPVNIIGANYFPDNGLGFLQLRPNVTGLPLYLYGSACAAVHRGIPCPGGMGFNPAAFSKVPTDTNANPTQPQGTLGRNVLRGFPAWQADFALHRQFRLTERFNLEFRGELFNLFNHPNFGAPFGRCCSGLFGEATSTLNRSFASVNQLYQIGGPRSIQLALKLQF